jgi:hypothetical protein
VGIEDVHADGAVVDDILVPHEWVEVTADMSFVPVPNLNVRLRSLVLRGLAIFVAHNFMLSSPEGFSVLSTTS